MEARIVDWGRVGYATAFDRQRVLHESVVAGEPSTLVLVEHPPVLTLGANFHEENLRLARDRYAEMGIEVARTDRGGDVTYHGPGQLVMYPIFNVADFGKDVHRWMRDLEETQLRTLAQFGIEGRRFPPHTGAWVGSEKVAAIGVKLKRWVSLHGIALNCDVDLQAFSTIVPCGIQGFGVTSLSRLLDRPVTIDEAKPVVIEAFADVFGLTWRS